MATNVKPFALPITQQQFEQMNGHKGAVFWFSGLSGAGKSTLAIEMQKRFFEQGKHVVVLDGDNIRSGLAKDLGFSEADRFENIRRSAEVAKLLAMHGNIVITAFITPTQTDRQVASDICKSYIHHVFINADLELCEQRDTKGLYKKARAGEIKEFTGISAPYDIPEQAAIVIDTSKTIDQCVQELSSFIESKTRL